MRLSAERESFNATRRGAATLFLAAYEEVRHGVLFLRWYEKDADDIAPSLYAGRGSRKKVASALSPSGDPTRDSSAVVSASNLQQSGDRPLCDAASPPPTWAAIALSPHFARQPRCLRRWHRAVRPSESFRRRRRRPFRGACRWRARDEAHHRDR